MKVMITGASGFVGLNIVEALLLRGDSVILFSHIPPPQIAMERFSQLPGEVITLTGDVRERSSLEQAFVETQPEHLVHGAAITPGATEEQKDFSLTCEVNVLGTLALLEIAQRFGIGRIVHLSSGSVYGQSAFAPGKLDEETTIPVPESLYSITKYAGERLALRFKTLNGLDLVVARLGGVFGAWERDTGVRGTLSPILQVTQMALSGQAAVLPGPGHKDWIYSRDLAAGVIALLDASNPTHDVYHVSSEAVWSVIDWCKMLAERYPDFSYRLADSNSPANVNFHGGRDRSPLNTARLTQDAGFEAKFGLAEAFSDYIEWVEHLPQGHDSGFWH